MNSRDPLADLAAVPIGPNSAYVRTLGDRLKALAPKPLRVMIVTSSVMKFQERNLLTFFDRAPLGACDWLAGDQPGRSLRPSLRSIRPVTMDRSQRRPYDCVVAFDANRTLLEQCERNGCPGVFIGKPRQKPNRNPASALAVAVHSTHRSLVNEASLQPFFPGATLRLRAGIDFPPNIDLHYEVPKVSRFELLIPGGGDRDYPFVAANREILPSQVLVTRSEDNQGDGPVCRHLLGGDPRFLLLSQLRGEDYAKLLLHSRVVLLPLVGNAGMDYTTIADAIWYGKPVLTNRVPGNAHMGDRVLFYEDARSLARRLEELQDPNTYERTSERIRAASRASCDFFGLLFRLYEDL